MSGPALGEVVDDDEEGTIECFFSTRFLVRIVVASSKGRPVCVDISGNIPSLMQRELENAFFDRSRYLKLAHNLDSVLDNLYKNQESYERIESLIEDFDKITNKVFSNSALSFIEPHKREACAAAMKERGFWKLLNKDHRNLKAFAYFGAIAALPMSDKRREFEVLRPNSRLRLINSALSKFGFDKTQVDTAALSAFI